MEACGTINQPEYQLCFWDEVNARINPQQKTIRITPLSTATTSATLEHLLHDQIYPRLLAHEGQLVLHAGAVDMDGKLAVFLGDSGMGKSTLVASLYQAGAALLNDDTLVVTAEADGFYGQAIYRGLRLLPDSLASLFPQQTETRPMAHYSPKQRLEVAVATADRQPTASLGRAVFSGAGQRCHRAAADDGGRSLHGSDHQQFQPRPDRHRAGAQQTAAGRRAGQPRPGFRTQLPARLHNSAAGACRHSGAHGTMPPSTHSRQHRSRTAMSSPTGYSVTSYGDMITSEPRMPAYAEALRQAVTPGCTVIDLGAGTGIFSLLACQYGAGTVTAIEPADAVLLLRETAEANGCADRISIVQGLSTEHVPPQKADVIVSDIRGTMPLFEHHIATIVDARERLLAPGGTLIPMRDTLRAALASHPEGYSPCEEPWQRNPYELDLRAGHRHAVNSGSKVFLQPEQLLSASAELAVLDYRTISSPNMSGKVVLQAERDGTAHGLVVWFDAELAPGIGFSNAPGQPKLVYGQSFFPFEQPLTLASGDRVEATIKANLVDGAYVWSWNSRLFRGAADKPELSMRQSSFFAQVLSPEKLARRADTHIPQPTPAHAVDQLCLSLIDGKHSLGEIADILLQRFPERFSQRTAALNHIAGLAGRY